VECRHGGVASVVWSSTVTCVLVRVSVARVDKVTPGIPRRRGSLRHRLNSLLAHRI
jgi:hypothetical protein